jgi:plastocyanin
MNRNGSTWTRSLRIFPVTALVLLLAPSLLADTVTLPAVTSLPVGSAASPFFSDVRVFNTSYGSPVTVTAVYRCFLGGCPGVAPQASFVLGARESRAFDDMILSTFNAPSTAGAVEFTSAGDSVRVTSRLYSPAAGGGTNGMFIPGMKVTQAYAVSVLTGLSNGLFRTNIGIYNGNDVGVTATIRLFNGTAQLGSQAVSLGPRSGTQINRIFDVMGQAGLVTTNAHAVVESSSASAPLFTYGAVIDNATADSSFVAGDADVPAPTGPPPTAQTINVDLTNYAFTPGTGSPIQVTAGAETTLVLTASQGSHGFSGVTELGITGNNNITAGTDDDGYGGGGQPPRTHRVTFTAPLSARGSTFQFFCTQHVAQNMRGTIHVN